MDATGSLFMVGWLQCNTLTVSKDSTSTRATPGLLPRLRFQSAEGLE